MEAARSSLATGTVVRAGVYPDLASRFDFWPVNTAEGQNAVVGLAFDPDEHPSTPDEPVDIVRGILALKLDRQHVRLDVMLGPQVESDRKNWLVSVGVKQFSKGWSAGILSGSSHAWCAGVKGIKPRADQVA